MKRKRSWTSPNWAGLDGDVLGLVLEKLFLLSDYIRFSVVCKSWNSIALFCKENRIEQSKHQPPWLLINGDNETSLYNFMTSEICKFKLQFPDQYEGLWFDSCHGWLFVQKTNNSKIMVLNPLSGKFFDLPPFDSSKINTEGHGIMAGLSRDPCLGSFEAFLSSDVYCAHIKYGDEYWTCSKQFDEGDPIINVAFFQGRRMLGLTFDCAIVSIDIISEDIVDSDSSKEQYFCYLKIREIAPAFEVPSCDHKGYLVKAINGDLLLVYRYHYRNGWNLKTYKIYKLIINSNGELEQIPVKTLGSECLFLGHCDSGISILASNYPEYKPNTIYNIVQFDGKYQIEVFSLDDGSFTRSCFPACNGSYPVWMVPTMKL